MNNLHFAASYGATSINKVYESDKFPLDDEEICETALNALLLVMNNKSRANINVRTDNLEISDYAALVEYGIRFPWKNKIAFKNFVDMLNDEVPDVAVIGRTLNTHFFCSAIYATKKINIKKLPRCLHGALHYYRVGYIHGYDKLSRQVCRDKDRSLESVVTPGYAAIFKDGVCISSDSSGKPNMWFANLLSYVIGMHNDKRYFWNVSAIEPFIEGYDAKAHFSIDEEYIKSLFYARSIPLTERGRLRPILHWVRAHQRRIKEGIEIDIKKHLRGISEFRMHNVQFLITNPIKSSK